MKFDKEALFSDSQAVDTATASTNVYNASKNFGKCYNQKILFEVTTAFVGSGTITATLQESDSATGTFSNVQELATFSGDAKGTYKGGVVQPYALSKKYLRINYTKSGTVTAGSVKSGFVTAFPNFVDNEALSVIEA